MATLESDFADQAIAVDKIQETNSSLMVVTIPLLLSIAGGPPQVLAEEIPALQDASASTNNSGVVVSFWNSDNDLSTAFNNVVDHLLIARPDGVTTARTALGKRLWELRARVVANGERLLTWDDIDRELDSRRGERHR